MQQGLRYNEDKDVNILENWVPLIMTMDDNGGVVVLVNHDTN